jgi:hypothetical protein
VSRGGNEENVPGCGHGKEPWVHLGHEDVVNGCDCVCVAWMEICCGGRAWETGRRCWAGVSDCGCGFGVK